MFLPMIAETSLQIYAMHDGDSETRFWRFPFRGFSTSPNTREFHINFQDQTSPDRPFFRLEFPLNERLPCAFTAHSQDSEY